tara:strand:- start:85 stop:1224 length:1140 start_codon:yes stop_codon:yes gene_type:complete
MAESIVGQETGRESSLSNWAGPYVTSMLGKGAALANENYQGYSGPLTAGQSNLQNQAFQGIAGLTIPTGQMGTYQPQSFTQQGAQTANLTPDYNYRPPAVDIAPNTDYSGLRSDNAPNDNFNFRPASDQAPLSPEALRFLRESDDPRARLLRDQAIPQPVSQQAQQSPQQAQQSIAQQYMNPYVNAALQPQLDELRRQSEMSRVQQAGRLTQAGAYGGSRQALADVELSRGMLANMANVTGQGYNQAYQQAQSQFNTEQQQGQQSQNFANQFGLQALANQIQAGQIERNIEQEGITADRLQFEEERDFPYKQVQYQQSLLQGLPIAAQSYNYAQPSALSDFLSGSGGVYDLLGKVFLPQEEEKKDSDEAIDNAQFNYGS